MDDFFAADSKQRANDAVSLLMGLGLFVFLNTESYNHVNPEV